MPYGMPVLYEAWMHSFESALLSSSHLSVRKGFLSWWIKDSILSVKQARKAGPDMRNCWTCKYLSFLTLSVSRYCNVDDGLARHFNLSEATSGELSFVNRRKKPEDTKMKKADESLWLPLKWIYDADMMRRRWCGSIDLLLLERRTKKKKSKQPILFKAAGVE